MLCLAWIRSPCLARVGFLHPLVVGFVEGPGVAAGVPALEIALDLFPSE
jgi:hypothetical protein